MVNDLHIDHPLAQELNFVNSERFSKILYILTIFDTKTTSKSALKWAENTGVNYFWLSGSSTTENKIENFRNFFITFTFHAPKNAEIFFWKWKLLKKIFPRIRKWTKNYKCKKLNSGNLTDILSYRYKIGDFLKYFYLRSRYGNIDKRKGNAMLMKKLQEWL